MTRNEELRAAIDRFGGELAAWPDRALAGEVRAAALADRDVRASLDRARALLLPEEGRRHWRSMASGLGRLVPGRTPRSGGDAPSDAG